MRTRRSPQYGHVPGCQAHEVASILRRMVEQAAEWQIPISVMDCDVAAAFDHVSHHVIIDAMEALKVPPLLVAAWIREYRGPKHSSSWTTSRHQKFVAHDLCHKETRAPLTCLGQHWIFQQQHFVKGVRWRSGGYLWKRDTWGFYFSRTTAGLSRCRQQN